MASEAEKLIESRLDTILYLAAIVSRKADFDESYGINLDGTRARFDAN
ncbi:hypothetical protein [Microvirga sp. BT325]|uniref:Uncharacterized protein n=1 Tax=Microvirga splendida TaxID=2795727 RepID=A0ABS0Y877_9HYPH|nr:hypothetical protein [Microvirga splendida]